MTCLDGSWEFNTSLGNYITIFKKSFSKYFSRDNNLGLIPVIFNLYVTAYTVKMYKNATKHYASIAKFYCLNFV